MTPDNHESIDQSIRYSHTPSARMVARVNVFHSFICFSYGQSQRLLVMIHSSADGELVPITIFGYYGLTGRGCV
jgi:hypothetical protein